MKTAVVRIQPDSPLTLINIIRQFNSACNWLSEYAFCHETYNWYRLQTRTYHELRQRFGLTAAQAVVAIRKVAATYGIKERRKQIIKFKPLSSMPLYQHRYKRDGTVLIYGVRYLFKARANTELVSKHEATLGYQNGKFIIHQVIDTAAPPVYQPKEWLGCDLGIVNILTDSTGMTYAGGHVNGLRHRHAQLRAKLQSKGTRSARRLLNNRRRKETLFARSVNHIVSKQIVAKAYGTQSGIALEELKGIRQRITARKAQRRQQSAWAFGQLGAFIEYKAAAKGVPVSLVDPRNSSRTCPACGCIDKHNRSTQSDFLCVSCGLAGLADHIAAVNISRRAASNQPDATPPGDLQVPSSSLT